MAPYYSIPSILTTIKFCLIFPLLVRMDSAQLSSDDYATSCPSALSTIKSAVESAVSSEARMGASLLCLHFHDCFVNARCDASVPLDNTPTDQGQQIAALNASLRGFEVIESQLENFCPDVVSCADILAVVARVSVVAKDSTTASSAALNSNIPTPTLDISDLINNFSNKVSLPMKCWLCQDLTVGQATCGNFRTRIYNETYIDPSYATSLKSNCPSTGSDSNLAL